MSAPLDTLYAAERALVRPGPAPERAAAMKAALTDKRFSDPGWIFERKLDGIRCIAIRSSDRVRLLSRNDLSLNGRYRETRSKDWLKLKCGQGQELVIGGYTAPHGARTDFGASFLGLREDKPARAVVRETAQA